MAFESISPNMNLILPGVGQTLGPQYATDLNNSLTLVDQHNHTAGYGVPVPSSGLNINADLSMGGNNLINIKSLRMTPQAILAGASDLSCLFVNGVDLYYNDGLGNHVRITQSGGVAGSPGSISNLTSPASASYVSGTSTFVWQSDANTPANMDNASIILRNLVANSFGLTLQPPASMASNTTITLPTIPASQKIMTLDNSGNMSAPYTVDNSTIEINANVIRVKDLGITAAKLAADAVTTTKIADDAVTTPKIADGAVTPAKRSTAVAQVSPSCGDGSGANTTSASYVDILNLSLTITTTGRPVVIGLSPDQSGLGPSTMMTSPNGCDIQILQDVTTILETHISNLGASAGTSIIQLPPSGINMVYFPAAGTYVFKAQMRAIAGANPFVRFNYTRLYAYEL